jgi:undecaprenyl-diphosphatase
MKEERGKKQTGKEAKIKILFLASLFLCFSLTPAEQSLNLDQKLFLKINGCRNVFFNWSARLFSDAIYIPQVIYYYSLGYGYFIDDTTAREFGTIGVATTFSTIATTQIVKLIFKRERPMFAVKGAQGIYAHGIFARLVPTEKYSCPSQSAALAASEAIVLGYTWPTWDKWFFTLMVLNGWSRIYQGAHYPGDVILGFIIGGATTYAVLFGLKKLDPDLDVKKSRPELPLFRIGFSF